MINDVNILQHLPLKRYYIQLQVLLYLYTIFFFINNVDFSLSTICTYIILYALVKCLLIPFYVFYFLSSIVNE